MTQLPPMQDLKTEIPESLLARRGDLWVRLAQTLEEKEAAKRLRYMVFFDEMGAQPSPQQKESQKDGDSFDLFCDHLLVVAPLEMLSAQEQVSFPEALCLEDGVLLATCRLLPQERADQAGGFYTQGEFDIGELRMRKPHLRYLELGRSCVLAPYRTPLVIDLLWRGIWKYARKHAYDVMLGCASLYGTDPEALAQELSLLAYDFAPPQEWHVAPVEGQALFMRRLAEKDLDRKQAMRALPPLVKGYLRLGCFIGDGAVLDPVFRTIDVLILMPVDHVVPRYRTYLDQATEEF